MRNLNTSSNGFFISKLNRKVRNPAQEIVPSLWDLISIELSDSLNRDSNRYIRRWFKKLPKLLRTSLFQGGRISIRDCIAKGFLIELGLFLLGLINDITNTSRRFFPGFKIRAKSLSLSSNSLKGLINRSSLLDHSLRNAWKFINPSRANHLRRISTSFSSKALSLSSPFKQVF